MKAVIFDLDGVLVDTERIRYQTYRGLFKEEFGVTLPEEIPWEILGRKEQENLAAFLRMHNIKSDIERLARKRHVLLEQAFSQSQNKRPMPGARSLLEWLRAKGIPMAVASSSSRTYVEKVLTDAGIRFFFLVVVSGDDVRRGKPAPDLFLMAARKLGVPPRDYIVFEDSPNGIFAAKAAGMRAIALASSLNKERLSGDLVISHLGEMRGML